MQQMGATSYQQIKQSRTLSNNARDQRYVRCVASAITDAMGGGNWEVNLFADDTANAFALPGGKIGVHTGLLDVAQTPDQLAAVLGHEVGHVIAHHSNERMSIQFATQTGGQLLQALSGEPSPEKQLLFAALGIGAQVGVQLPFSRKHESESDLIGLELMAKAGFDPRASVTLWQNMAKQGGEKPPEFLSTHPSNETRIQELSQNMNKALPLYRKAKQSGETPNCQR
ncbi:peptidase M48, Ste24p [gamma proteobacterium HTCC5015]|nr:peptidase M48, Ste24p [gamma proteobacterium HTCC5015]